MKDKRILLIIGGGIAAYKCLELIRRLRADGALVRTIMTRAAHEFVTPLSVASLSGEKVYTDLFDLTDEAEMGHIELSRDADLLIVAPATADLMARMAQGLANDLASTALLATNKPVMIAPAMNVRMWLHPATQRNVTTLLGDGISVIGPNEGDMACGEFGPGRMAEPSEIVGAVQDYFAATDQRQPLMQPLRGRRALVTSGPTYEAIDPVRYIANRSSGKQGHAIATALAGLGAQTILVSGPTAQADPIGVEVRHVESAQEMLAACEAAIPVDIAVFVAAVADWRAAAPANKKVKKTGNSKPPTLKLVENPDICRTISQLANNRPELVIGFGAETEDVVQHAIEKRQRKGCDWLVANDVSPDTGIMGGDENAVHLITPSGSEGWARMSKTAVAEALAQRIAIHFETRAGSGKVDTGFPSDPAPN